jgi:hypothetical protein
VDAFDERVADYLEGRLAEAEVERLAEQVRADEALRRRFLELAGVEGLLRAELAPPEAGDDLARRIAMCLVGPEQEERTAEAVLRRIEDRPGSRTAPRTRSVARLAAVGRSRARTIRFGTILAVAAACVAVAFGVRVLLESRRGPEIPADPQAPVKIGVGEPEIAHGGVDKRGLPVSRATGEDPRIAPRPDVEPTTSVPVPSPEPGAGPVVTDAPRMPGPGAEPPATRVSEGPSTRTSSTVPAKETASIAARLDQVKGDIRLSAPAGLSAGRPGQALLAGQGLRTGGGDSRAVVTYPDGTSLVLGTETEIRIPAWRGAEAGKRLFVVQGMVAAEVARQPADQPMVFETAQGEAKVLGTSLRLVVDPGPEGAMRLEVREGKVRLTRTRDGRSVDVATGHFAEIAHDAELGFPRRVQTVSFQDGAAPVAPYKGTRDTYIAEYKSGLSRNFSSSGILVADGDSTDISETGMDRSALVGWDLSAIPRGVQVIWAEIGIQVVNDSGGRPFGIYALKREWVEGQVTWQGPAKGVAWQIPGAQGGNDRDATSLGALAPAVLGPCAVPLNRAGLAVVQAWIGNPAANHGVIVADTNNGDALIFKSRKAPAPAERPRLTISFVTR